MSDDRTLPPIPFTLSASSLTTATTASSTPGLPTPGTISASASSSNLTQHTHSYGYHPYAQGYHSHHHSHATNSPPSMRPSYSHGSNGGVSKKHRSSARSGYTTTPVSVATSPINSRPSSPLPHFQSLMGPPSIQEQEASQATKSALALSRRSAPTSPRVGLLSLSSSGSSSLIHGKQYHHPHPKLHAGQGNRDSHLARSVRIAFGMTPITATDSSPSIGVGAIDGMMDMELDGEESGHVSLPPLKKTRIGGSSFGVSSRSTPASRKTSLSPRMEGVDEDSPSMTDDSPDVLGLELPPLHLSTSPPQQKTSPPTMPTLPSLTRVPGSRLDLTSMTSSTPSSTS